ncbi:hypothetical protein V5O48_015334 [Marasmius crinis-equi]|uniref:UbiA prenyltransferase n=1 Tax=Marasmius crinis-equi TaxID=585013 RepID=A0ABR3EUU6_9AGAR
MDLSVFSKHKKHVAPWLSLLKDNLLETTSQLLVSSMNVAHIGYAFTMSDIKTITVPVTFYGLVSSPQLPGIHTTARLLVWVWVNLLHFCAANQMYSAEEDAANKPYRPIPAGLMTVKSAVVLRWALIPICLLLSWMDGALLPGISLCLSFLAYNEGGLDSRWQVFLFSHRVVFFLIILSFSALRYSKSLLNAWGIVSWDVGASIIASAEKPSLHERYWLAPFLSFGLIWTTIHIQDFRDEVGDRMQGRITFPTLSPEGSRYFTLFIINLWTIGLGWYWNLSMVGYSLFAAFGLYLSLRTFLQRTEHDDKVSLRVYMLWLTIARTLPFLAEHGSLLLVR